MDLKDLTPEEREFIRKYRKLDSIDRARVEERIDEMNHEQRKSKFKVCKKEAGTTRKE